MKLWIAFASTLIMTTTAMATNQLELEAQGQTVRVSAQDNIQSQERTVDRYSYNFGRVWLYSTQYISYKLTNTGTTPLTFQQAVIGGADYSAIHSCKGVLAPNTACRFEIRFNPIFEGIQSGRFILSFVENLDIVVDLWGEGYRM